MPLSSLDNLPPEMVYLIFKYLGKEHIVYSFLELNNYFSLLVKYFIGKQLDLTKISNNTIFQYCLTTVLPSIGSNFRCLSIGYPYCLSTYVKSLKTYCSNLDILHIYCCPKEEDIRLYLAHFLHHQLVSLTFMLKDNVVGEQISLRLLNKSTDEQYPDNPITSSLILHLSSLDDLILLKRYSESNYLSDGFYMIESVSNGEWLTESKDDLCLMSKKFHRECIFSIKQINNDQFSLEYELYNEQTQERLTVLIHDKDEEYWVRSSILSTHRKQSNRSCSTFTFEKIDHDDQYYIRPCYPHAKRLQVSGKRIIVALCDNDNVLNHRFRLHRIL